MDASSIVPIAETTRGGVVESIHHGIVVALRADGSVAWCVGDPETAVYPRSALKPLQAQAMVEAGLDLADPELAVACGSHDGRPFHLDAVRTILGGVGLDETALANTPALPLGADAASDVLRAGGAPSSLSQNCSGKHAAMLATCVVNGWAIDGYLDFNHPVQQVIDAYISKVAGGVSHTAVDGCGAPTAMTTLAGLAAGVRDLAVRRERTCVAMTSHPRLVAGDDRDDTRLMQAVDGLVAKGGAEGVHVAAHADGRAVAVKVADGSGRARLPVMLAALDSIGFDVDGVVPPAVLGHGRPVGEVRALVP